MKRRVHDCTQTEDGARPNSGCINFLNITASAPRGSSKERAISTLERTRTTPDLKQLTEGLSLDEMSIKESRSSSSNTVKVSPRKQEDDCKTMLSDEMRPLSAREAWGSVCDNTPQHNFFTKGEKCSESGGDSIEQEFKDVDRVLSDLSYKSDINPLSRQSTPQYTTHEWAPDCNPNWPENQMRLRSFHHVENQSIYKTAHSEESDEEFLKSNDRRKEKDVQKFCFKYGETKQETNLNNLNRFDSFKSILTCFIPFKCCKRRKGGIDRDPMLFEV